MVLASPREIVSIKFKRILRLLWPLGFLLSYLLVINGVEH